MDRLELIKKSDKENLQIRITKPLNSLVSVPHGTQDHFGIEIIRQLRDKLGFDWELLVQ